MTPLRGSHVCRDTHFHSNFAITLKLYICVYYRSTNYYKLWKLFTTCVCSKSICYYQNRVYLFSERKGITAFISSFVYVVVSAVAWRLAAWRCKTLGKPFRGGVNPKGNHVAFWLNIELTYSQRMTHSAIEDLIMLRTSLCM